MPDKIEVQVDTPKSNLSLLTKLIYGSGDWGRASFNTLRQFFYAIFLTDVVGIEPRLASIAALISILWDAVNDPIVGTISDNVRTKWGRRRPFLLIFAIPFALAYILLWWAPPWQSQVMLAVHVTLAYMFSDTIQTLVTVPYLSLTPEISKDYDERTSVTSFRMFFNLIASLITAVAAPMIMDSTLAAGLSIQQAYITIAALFGGLSAIPFFLIFFTIKEKDVQEEASSDSTSFADTFRALKKNIPFRYTASLYVLNWLAVDIESLMIPYFLLYIISRGNFLAKANIFGINLAMESAVIGAMMITAVITIPIWNWLAHRFSKRSAYIAGMTFWIIVQLFVFSLRPGQTTLIVILAALAGFGVSTAHIIPEAIFPDVIDWDEFTSHKRREGIYYGAINFLRKISSAVATFLVLQILGWSGYQTPPMEASEFFQPDKTIFAIRFLTGPIIVLILLSAIYFASRYPLSRERQQRVQKALLRRERRMSRKMAKNTKSSFDL